MSRPMVLAGLVAAAVAACSHSQRVGEAGGSEGSREPSKRETRVPPRAGRPAVAADPSGLMRPGSARRIEQALRSKGYLRQGSADARANDLDPSAAVALRRFQRDQGLAETGAPDRETLRRLGVDPQDVYSTAPQGDRGASQGTGSE